MDTEIIIATGKRYKWILTPTSDGVSYEFDCVKTSGHSFAYTAKCEKYITEPVYTVYNENGKRVDSFTWSNITSHEKAA